MFGWLKSVWHWLRGRPDDLAALPSYETIEETYRKVALGRKADKPPMRTCPFCRRRSRSGQHCCSWAYLVIHQNQPKPTGRRNPHKGFVARVLGAARASGQRCYKQHRRNCVQMQKRSVRINQGVA